jgi:hypothetical protein
MQPYTDHKQRYIDAFKDTFPYDFQVHLTVTPPRYAVGGNIKYATNYDATGYTPFFPDSNKKVNLWFIDSVLKPLETCALWSNSPLYALSVVVPKQPYKPQHIHCALGTSGEPISASHINAILEHIKFTSTTALATDFQHNTENYIYKHLYQRDIVCSPHCWNMKPKKQTLIPNI